MRTSHESLDAFVGYATRTDEIVRNRWGNPHERSSRHSGEGLASWCGTDTFDDAVKLAREGWEQGRNFMESHRASVIAILGDRIRRAEICNDVAGFAPDVGAFLVGDPEAMFSRTVVEQSSAGKVLRVVFSCEAHACATVEDYAIRGGLICAVVDALELAGYQCEIAIDSTVFCRGVEDSHTIELKRAGEALDIDRLAFCAANMSFLRRLIFSANELNPKFFKAGEYGSSRDAPEGMRGNLYFPCAFRGDVEPGRLVAWVKAQLAPLGITFDE